MVEQILENCPECFGKTVLFTGKGKDMQYRVCPRWQDPGHLTEAEINQLIYQVRMQVNPSSRFA